jgi:uncharacterized protein RhaS with RHS repeats
LHYNYFRDYDPAIGRYVQSDPIGLEAGLNTYSYVDGGPLTWTDVYGFSKGGKRNLNTQGFTKQSCPQDIEKALKEAKTPAQRKALRALLKVVKRGGSMGLAFTLWEEFKRCETDPCSCDPNSMACLLGPA